MHTHIGYLLVEALRSSKYKQGQGSLRAKGESGTEFCCLGVLCNLHAQAHPEIAANQPATWEYMGEQAILPRAVRDWAGMNSCDGSYSGPTPGRVGAPLVGGAPSLIDDNDAGVSFAQIAAIITDHMDEL